ncbi:MAG: plastocyanin/azurin family copper-binding protein [Chthoniobacterales bacterium]
MKTKQNHRVLLGLCSVLLGAIITTTAVYSQDAATAKEVEITANDQMKFDLATIEVQPGQEVKLTLKNIGKLPKQAMGHNWMLLKADTDVAKFVTTGMTHAATEYIAPEFKDQVLAYTKLLGPDESDTITFTAPTEPGTYPFICSFPAHYLAGMKGELIVK